MDEAARSQAAAVRQAQAHTRTEALRIPEPVTGGAVYALGLLAGTGAGLMLALAHRGPVYLLVAVPILGTEVLLRR